MRIMLADDDESMRTLVEYIILKDGHEFYYATDGEEALQVFETEKPDLVVLDVMMPKINGFEVCRAIRDGGSMVPIIFLTAKGDIVDKNTGFKAGGDDYLVKPFTSQELSLRIEALLRRAVPSKQTEGPAAELLSWDGLEIDTKKRRVSVRGRQVELTPKEFHLLHILAASPGEVFTRDQLINDVWGPEYMGESSSITVFVHRIREKIEEDPSSPKYLQTVWHVGYRFGS